MSKGIHTSMAILLLLFLLPTALFAQVPDALSFQGRLTMSPSGLPIADGQYSIAFRIYNGPEQGATLLWSETLELNTKDGLFNTILGLQNPIPEDIFNGGALYVGMQIGGDAEMYPRTPLLRSPYAFQSKNADSSGIAANAYHSLLSDSAVFASNSENAIHSDSAVFAQMALSAVQSDSASYAESSRDAIYSDTAAFASEAEHALNADQALYASDIADSTVTSEKLTESCVTSTHIQDASIMAVDLNQNGASEGQVLKWNGSAWVAAEDSVYKGQDLDWIFTTDSNDIYSGISGNVGIGTDDPQARLDVNGTLHAQGTITSGNSLVLDGNTGTIASSNGRVSFDDDDLATDGRVNFGPSNINSGISSHVLGSQNRVYGDYSAIAGGGGATDFDSNSIIGAHSFIGGGHRHNIFTDKGTIGGGERNHVDGEHGTVGGGYFNQVNANGGTVAGGSSNRVNGLYAFTGGGAYNHANGNHSVVVGGEANSASGSHAFIGGGSDNIANGNYACVLGGQSNVSAATSAIAAGVLAYANHHGSIVLSANTWVAPGADYIFSGGPEQFVIRADSGIYIATAGGVAPFNPSRLINTASGAYLSSGGTWVNSSDRALKENFRKVNNDEIIDRLAELEINEWNYKKDGRDIRHIGPTSQDFYRLFGLGHDDKSIATVDPDGIALAAIQALYRTSLELQQKTDRIEELEDRITRLEKLIENLDSGEGR